MSINVATIKQRVRFCLDEEAVNLAQIGVGNNDDAYMDNIIADKIPDAVRWCALYAPDGLLRSEKETSGETSKGWSVAAEGAFVQTATVTGTTSGGCTTFTLPTDFGRLVRVRLTGWSKAVRTPIEEDSDEYLMVDADTARATADRPVAALIRTSPMKLECWPGVSGGGGSSSISICYVSNGSDITTTGSSINIPSQLEPAFIYYLAFLVATAYRDSIASSLLHIAKMHLGLS